jgi:starvation-inducible DNA-binding protein
MTHTLTARMFDTHNDLPPATRASVVELLNERLADVIDLELQAKQAHWNIKGPNFVGLHELFDRVALQAREHADEIAERAVALGGVARGTIEEIAGQSTLPAYPLVVDDWGTHVRAMQAALATFGRAARRAIDEAAVANDADTVDLFTAMSRGIDKLLWMVEAHVQEAPRATVRVLEVEAPASARELASAES